MVGTGLEMKELVEQVREAGVVGSGGAGFPTHVKLEAQAEWYLANGAECEPLMHKDRELMVHFGREVVDGLEKAADCVQAQKTAIGIKSKNRNAIDAIQAAIRRDSMHVHEFGDFYPAGDEYELVYGITGRLIPPQGIPLNIGVVVNNIETLVNISRAVAGKPVTDTFMTLTGLVKTPLTTWLPIGLSVREALQIAGGPMIDDFAVMESGLMMGKLVQNLDQPITKTTGGLIVLPAAHDLIKRISRPTAAQHRIGHSACDQCSYCTELCPRYLLGYEVKPHLVMRSLGFTQMGKELWNQNALLCCQCGLCTLYACPEGLYPREACVQGMNDLRKADKGKWTGSRDIQVHPMKNSRRVPIKMLMNRLGVSQYESHAEYQEMRVEPARVVMPLKQHVGQAAEPVVKVGESVRRDQLIAEIPDGKLGARVHASIDGKVSAIQNERITIERG